MTNEPEIRNEEILLPGLCRLSFSKEQTAKIRELINTITDWDYFAFLANEHGIAALSFHNLEQLGFLRYIPDNIISVLKNALLLSISRNAFHIEVISEVLRIFNKENIKVVLLKGLALELTVYGNAGLRQMTDVDILVDRKHHVQARNLLIDNGYESFPIKSVFHKPIIAWSGKHLPTLVKNGASIDMHLELFGGKRNSLTNLLFENSTETVIKDQTIYIPHPQLFFLYLVRHLYLHEIRNESQLRLYTDLVVLIEKYRDQIINFDLIEYASKAGMSEILAWRLEPLRDFWGIQFPDWVNDFIDKWHDPASINKFVLFLKAPKNNPPLSNALVYRSTIKEIPGLHRKILFVLGDLFPTFAFMKSRYKCNSNLKALFYYPHRLGKIVWLFWK
jgi:hypothetical protein